MRAGLTRGRGHDHATRRNTEARRRIAEQSVAARLSPSSSAPPPVTNPLFDDAWRSRNQTAHLDLTLKASPVSITPV